MRVRVEVDAAAEQGWTVVDDPVPPGATYLARGFATDSSLAAPGGTPVKAVAAGRVVYADWLRGFGNLLIVDHGEDYLSLYGYNEALLKQVGDSVGGGETLATVGNSGGSTQSGLYFEIRHQGKPIDPMTWAGR
mgnify:CR=1 FL=1